MNKTKTKPKFIQDYAKLSVEWQEQIKLVYPEGYSEFLIEFTNQKGEIVSALPFETDEKVYMVRMSKRLANQLVDEDDDFDADGNLKSDVKDAYEDKHSEVDYLSENDNYNDNSYNDDDDDD